MPKPFDIFAEFAKFGVQQRISLRDPAAAPAFVAHVEEVVRQALGDDILVHGQRSEAMFEALLVSLGGFALLKHEDSGRIYPADDFRVPDFRLVLNGGSQWLIEVKNVRAADASPVANTRRLMKRAYYEKLHAYAAATGGELKLAIFWSNWQIWTLVSPAKLLDENGDLRLNMAKAMMVNEMGAIGDRMIGTRPSLRLRLTLDPEKTTPLTKDQEFTAWFKEAQVFCGDNELLDPIEQEVAWFLMRHGEWEETHPEIILDGERPQSIEFRWEPSERQNEAENFEIVGTLSRMFARNYAEQTVVAGEVTQVRAPIRPGWFTPLLTWNYRRATLPLWQFIMQANYDGEPEAYREQHRAVEPEASS